MSNLEAEKPEGTYRYINGVRYRAISGEAFTQQMSQVEDAYLDHLGVSVIKSPLSGRVQPGIERHSRSRIPQ